MTDHFFCRYFVLIFFALCVSWISAALPATLAQTPTPECIHHGDVNLDGEITASDAQTSFLITLGLFTPTFEQECAADCNADGDVTAGDAQMIFLVVLGMANCSDPLATPTPTPAVFELDVVYIAPGSFIQGSPDAEPCRWEGEGPQHQVTLTRGFNMMTTEVTRQLWADLAAVQSSLPTDPSSEFSPSMDHPADQVLWYEAILFANLLSIQNGMTQCYYSDEAFTAPITSDDYLYGPFFCNFGASGYRLPTEAEWEYAARAGTTGIFSCEELNFSGATCFVCAPGSFTTLEQHAVFCANYPGGAAVSGSKLQNPWGLFDIHGNLAEWCWDWMSDYTADPIIDPTGAATGFNRIAKSGAWTGYPSTVRSAWRGPAAPDSRSVIGFRLIQTVP
ncbi:SUMF1/EgtB/PvdO family nonheme iron enzyme [bacterium]|nr:SUMF1/EgtB/PvdO family nonheme iron enzyme [candidate division CSSED10-310 bacterium]